MGTGNLTVNRACGIRIVTEVYCRKGTFAERFGSVESPQRGFQGLHHIACASDVRRFSAFERAFGHHRNLFGKGLRIPDALHRRESGLQKRVLVGAGQRRH